MPLPTLLRQGHPLADPAAQLRLLASAAQPPFEQVLADSGQAPDCKRHDCVVFKSVVLRRAA